VLASKLLASAWRRRLAILEALRRDPATASTPIERPVFVLGFPRTGTSLLFHLLTLDPEARPLLGWEALDPLPPRRRPGGADPRVGRWRRAARLAYRAAPGLRHVHPLTETGPEECLALLVRGFTTWAWLLFARLPSYDDWLWSRPPEAFEPTYRLHAAQLRLLQRQRAGGYWLLKSPAHLNALEALLRVYPDARVVCTHRDLAAVIPSSCSLFAVFRSIYSDRVDAHELGREALRTTERTVRRTIAVRDRLPPSSIVDVRYEDLVRDPAGTLRTVWEALGRTITPAMEEAAARDLERATERMRPDHRYSLEQFGLRRDEIETIAAPYHDAFLA
jgi:hypothetical protein